MVTKPSSRKRRVASAAERRLARAFLMESRRRLRLEYLPKIRATVARLDQRAVWWRPNPHSNSIGNLVLHLEGNVRQWILGGVAGGSLERDRDAEFTTGEGAPGRVLVAHLARTLRQVDAALAAVPVTDLLALRTIQGYRCTVLAAVYHVVEHFSGHTGQIIWIAKQQRDRDFEFYPHLAPKTRRRRRARQRRYM